MHSCPECGFEHETIEAETAAAPEIVIPGTSENDVRIAEVEAAAGLEETRIFAEQRDVELAAEVERLRGEVAGMREVLDRIAPEPQPEPEPEPVVVPVPEPEAAAEPVPGPPETEHKPRRKNSGGYWGGYR